MVMDVMRMDFSVLASRGNGIECFSNATFSFLLLSGLEQK